MSFHRSLRHAAGVLAASVLLLAPLSSVQAVVLGLVPPGSPLVAESGPFGFGGRGVVFRAEQDFTMSAFAMEGRWDNQLDLGIDVYTVPGVDQRNLLSQSTATGQTWSGDAFTTLSHTQSFTAGNIYEIVFRFSDPGLIFPHYNFQNGTLDPGQGFLVGSQMLVLDGSDFDTGLQSGQVWLANFRITIGEPEQGVPEPASLALLGVALAGLAGAGRRKAA